MKSRLQLLALAALAAGLFNTARAAVETYAIDPVHSSVAFTIRHLVSKVPGRFDKFEGNIVVDREKLANSNASVTVEASSINTSNEKRDTHLRSPDFFEVAKFGTLTFKSTEWKQTGENTFDVSGDLTIHGVTKPVVLKTTLLGFSPGMQPGTQVSGWEASTTINRRDFGVNGPAVLGKTVGDEVTIAIAVEAQLKK